MLRKPQLYARVYTLRKQGFSYNEILKQVSVAQSTLSRWCRSIPLTPEQQARLNQLRAQNPWILSKVAQKTGEEKEAAEWAQQIVKSPSFPLPLGVAGVMLYLAEGAKTKTYFEIFNSDPLVLQISIKFLEKVLGIKREQMRISLRLYQGIKRQEAETYWSKLLQIPLNQFTEPELITKTTTSRKKRLTYGMCRLRVHRRDAFKRTIALSKLLFKLFEDAPVVQSDRTSRS